MANFKHSLQSKKVPSMEITSVHLSVNQYHILNYSTDTFKAHNTSPLKVIKRLFCVYYKQLFISFKYTRGKINKLQIILFGVLYTTF